MPPHQDGTPREMPRRPRDPSLHWSRPPHDLLWIDGNHHPYWLTRGLTAPTRVAPGITYLPRGTVLTLSGERGPRRVGVLGCVCKPQRHLRLNPYVAWRFGTWAPA